jgi:hypothetical protein
VPPNTGGTGIVVSLSGPQVRRTCGSVGDSGQSAGLPDAQSAKYIMYQEHLE